MNRRSFMIRVGGALVAVPAVLQLTACGDDGGGGGTPDADTGGATNFNISSTGGDHVHMLTVECSDLSSTSDVTYTSAVGSGHTHQVTIPAADLATINGGGSVTITTNDFHTHMWTISKPSSACTG